MSPSQEILNSIDDRLRQIAQEIAALESARAELQGDVSAEPKPAGHRAGKPRARTPRKPRAVTAPATAQATEEEWLARRAAELAAQSRTAAAA